MYKLTTQKFLCSFAIFVLLSVMFVYNLSTNKSGVWNNSRRYGGDSAGRYFLNSTLKTILLWNSSPERVELISFGTGSTAFEAQNCRFTQCEIVINVTERPIDSYDAVVFNIPDLRYKRKLAELKFVRKQRQRFIFFSQESPAYAWHNAHRLNASDLGDFFNWTMTYLLDSDIRLFYGRINMSEGDDGTLPFQSLLHNKKDIDRLVQITRTRTLHKKWPAKINNKKKLVAWMVSHCETDSLRELYVKQLNHFITVDIYGNCGLLNCSRTWDFSTPECYDMLESNYKFYLSFENSVCPDYVTEKFFHAMSRYIIPVVYGGANYSRIAPPHSYIDVRDFQRPKDLADYLLKLDANETLYHEYFWWKDVYTVEAGLRPMARHAFCDLCEKLHLDHPSTNKFISKQDLLLKWDSNISSCIHPIQSRKNDKINKLPASIKSLLRSG